MQHLANCILLGGLSGRTQVTKESFEWKESFEKIGENGLTIIGKNFDQNKPTVIFLAGNGGIDAQSLCAMKNDLSTEYNFALIDYPNLRGKKCSLDYLVQSSQECLDVILKDLRTKYGKTDVDSVKEKVILSGFSMGTMIATKLAAQNVKNKGKPFKLLLNIASPLNMKSASKQYMELGSGEGKRVMTTHYIAVNAVLFGVIYGVSYATLFHGKQMLQSTSLCNAAYVATGAVVLINALVLFAVSSIFMASLKSWYH